jgi:hypothetical protein
MVVGLYVTHTLEGWKLKGVCRDNGEYGEVDVDPVHLIAIVSSRGR